MNDAVNTQGTGSHHRHCGCSSQARTKQGEHTYPSGPPEDQPGSHTDAPRHLLFIGAESRFVFHLVQLVYFMLLQREPNTTVNRRVRKPRHDTKAGTLKGLILEVNMFPSH